MTVEDSFVRRGFEVNSWYSFFAATVWSNEPLDLQLKHIQAGKNFFVISAIDMNRRTDIEKISQFLGRIRTGSSYLKLDSGGDITGSSPI